MPSARRSKIPRKGCAILLASVPAVLLILWILLATGGLQGLIRTLVNRATAGGEVTVDVFGGRSDIYGSTWVDSVIVSNPEGLRVAVYGARVSGSVYGYFFRNDVSSITVDSLIVVTPSPSADAPEDSSLTPVFAGTMAGIVTRTDNLSLGYGRVEQFDGTLLVDSMGLDASILSIQSPELLIRKASAHIPLFGSVEASGTLLLDSSRTTLSEFTASCPPGDFSLHGYLDADSTADLTVSGTASTGFLSDLPLVTLELNGRVAGSIASPEAMFAVTAGCMNYQGLMVGITVDTLTATRTDCSVGGLHLRTGTVALDARGNLGFQELDWTGGLFLSLQNTDASSYFPDLPETDLTGTVSTWLSGREGNVHSVYLNGGFTASRFMDYSVSSISILCQGDPSGVEGTLTAGLAGGEVSTSFDVQLGMDYAPVAWSASAAGYLGDLETISTLTDPLLMNVQGLSMNVSGGGSLSEFSLRGTAGIDAFMSDSVQAAEASFTGNFSMSGRGMDFRGRLNADSLSILASDLFTITELDAFVDMSARGSEYAGQCTLSVGQGTFGDYSAGDLDFTGQVRMDDSGISGTGWISSDSIMVGQSGYSLAASFSAGPGNVSIDSLTLGAPGSLELILAGLFSYGPDSLAFSLDGIALTRAGKLRLISQGDLEVSSDSSGIQLDTLWLDLPSGEITAEGWMLGDSLELQASLDNVDIASFTSMFGIPVPVSGILEADCSLSGRTGAMRTDLSIFVDHPTYSEWDHSDSLTLDLLSSGDSLIIDGLWSWTDGVRSGFRTGLDGIWDRQGDPDLHLSDVMWAEAELTGVGDELFYLLPMPFKTNGASVSARIEYQRDTREFSAGIASHFDRVYITSPGLMFPGVTVYLTYPDAGLGEEYNGSVTLNSGEGGETSLTATLKFMIDENLTFDRGSDPLELEAYDLRVDLSQWETLIAGVGWIQMSGSLLSHSSAPRDKPRITGKIEIDQAVISMGGGGTLEGSGSGGGGEEAEIPLDLNIKVVGERGIWFRNNFANAEFSTTLDITTVESRLMVGGEIRAVRGGVYILGREFRITSGEVRILQTSPMGIELDITAESRIRSSVSGSEYTITVTVTGDPEEPEITLTGTGPDGAIGEQDIVTLLTAGMTYGELQQFDSTALGSVAGNYLGQWLARSIRDDVGLDALQVSPEFSSDTTSLVVNAGKYVLPDLFVSYSSDVFSSDAGTISAQYFFSRDFFLEGSTKSTLTGRQDPSLELHYTYRY